MRRHRKTKRGERNNEMKTREERILDKREVRRINKKAEKTARTLKVKGIEGRKCQDRRGKKW